MFLLRSFYGFLALATFLLPICPAGLVAEELRVASIFSDHMVLQQQAKLPIWGTAEPGATITISFVGKSKSTVVGEDGKWIAFLDEMAVVDEPQEMIVRDSHSTITYKNVVVGEVWFASGQSNMEFAWTFSDEFKKRRAAKEQTPERASDPKYYGSNVDQKTMHVLRRAIDNPLVRISSKTRDHLITPDSGWARITEDNVLTLPALPGCIAVYLQEELRVPVGIIIRAVSSTHTTRWITKEGFMNDPIVKRQIEVYRVDGGAQPALTGTDANKGFGNLYREYVQPVAPYAIRGFLWDQGEQGIGYRGVDWTGAIHALVSSWRQSWQQGDLPWSATDHYPDELESRVQAMGIERFMIAKTDKLSQALHPLNKWKYAQKHLENILPVVYMRPAPVWSIGNDSN